ncbi:hypothetical protein N7491_006270 [Penicillium cf. griseofulvum]|uniref:Uncharacterized protein n=1 Tax=Penicillium cf. griseofulvum TaxID=2972120 RepID=A0A9W9M258_9EURO|nr:hypothetical protein N7472_010699 [Penicillium cf. griseofulvum]KAJ5429254.1 hypothetical protein N7491_006270 [Penicillium cf. griseofulvum]KAJ5436953.1 hypothetical protein N7445_007838 [Penicillium cf. griseofulvum]
MSTGELITRRFLRGIMTEPTGLKPGSGFRSFMATQLGCSDENQEKNGADEQTEIEESYMD